ncbi:MAG: hypothetical protein ACD_10C00171G0001, partial [uncultured bacterium]
LIVMLWLSACAMGGSDGLTHACPPVVVYSRSEQSQAAAEVARLAKDSPLLRLLSDYAVLRDQARACNSGN